MNKNINKILVLLLAVFVAGCSSYEDTEVLSPLPADGNLGVFFPTPAVSSFELEPTDATEIVLTVSREVATGNADVPVIVETNDDDVFNVPSTVSFANGAKDATLKVTFPTAAEGKKYNLKLAVQGDAIVNPYSAYLPNVSINVTRIKWEALKDPMVYVDGAFSAGYSVNSYPVYVNAEKAQLGQSVRYRFKNVYKVPSSKDPDADGIYDGFPYNSPGDFDESKDYYTVIEIMDPKGVKGNVNMFFHEVGVDWGYGMISIGSNGAKVGTLANGLITFPTETLVFSEKNYKNGELYPAEKSTKIYMTKQAFIAANIKITDFNKIEYEPVEGEVGSFETAAYGETWDRSLSKAIDIDEANKDSEYKNLYYLADLYAKNFGVAFYYTNGKIRIPEKQPIGTNVFENELYVSQSSEVVSSVETDENGVTIYTLGLQFHFKDGTVVGDFAEKFYYAEEAADKTRSTQVLRSTGNSTINALSNANFKIIGNRKYPSRIR